MALCAAPSGSLCAQESEPPAYPYDLYIGDILWGHLFEGNFREPRGLFFDTHTGELFVADSKRNLIGIYQADGTPLFTFGGRHLMTEPVQLSVTEEGDIIVLDGIRTHLKVFDYRGQPQGTLEFRYPEVVEDGPEVVRITAFTRGPAGEFFVADQNRPQILVYTGDLEFVRSIEPAPGRGRFLRVTGLAVSPRGDLAVLDGTETPVQIFSPSGRFLRGFGHRDLGKDGFTAPEAAVFADDGFLYIVDALRHEVKVFDIEGRYQTSFGGWTLENRGRGPGEMLFPVGIAIQPGGPIYVSERFGNRIQAFRRVPKEESGAR